MSKEIVVIAKFIIKLAKISDTKKIVTDLIFASRQGAGCLYYAFYQDPECSNKFVMVERWKSKELWSAHIKAAHVRAALPKLEACLQEPTQVNYYELID